ncbi:MAG: hypothetical protein ABI706_00290 [Ilumatobacteraceae bacterium]
MLAVERDWRWPLTGDHRRGSDLVADEPRTRPGAQRQRHRDAERRANTGEALLTSFASGALLSDMCAARMLAVMATPSDAPTWRCVEKIDDARPGRGPAQHGWES